MPTGPVQAGEISSADVEAARHGDRAAAARLLSALLPRARNLVRYLVRSDREVDDVVQEGLVAVVKGLASYRGEGAFRSWADRVIARSTFACLERRRAQDARTDPSVEVSLQAVAPDEFDDFLSRRRLVEALDALPAEQRHALVLHHVLEMSVPEIADETRAPEETVRSRLRLGRVRLRAALGATLSQKVS